MSDDNKRIFIGGIPETKSKWDVWEEVHKVGMKGVVDVIMYSSHLDPQLNRGFVFIEFKTHQLAANVIEEFRMVILFGTCVKIDWASPIQDIPTEILSKVKKLFMRNLHPDITTEEWRNVIEKIIPGITLQKVYKHRNYSFVHFQTRNDAKMAFDALKRAFRDTNIEISWARPQEIKSSKNIKFNRFLDVGYASNDSTYEVTDKNNNFKKEQINLEEYSRNFHNSNNYGASVSNAENCLYGLGNFDEKIDSFTSDSPLPDLLNIYPPGYTINELIQFFNLNYAG